MIEDLKKRVLHVESLEQTNADMSLQISDLTQQLHLHRSAVQTVKEMQIKSELLMRDHNAAKSDLDRLMVECERLRADNETTHHELTVLKHEHSVLMHELDVAERDRETYKAEAECYRQNFEQYKKECDFLKLDNARLLTQYEHMSSELSQLTEAHNIALQNS